MADEKLRIVVEAIDDASGEIKKIDGALGGLAKLAGGALATGLTAAAAGVAALGGAVIELAKESIKLTPIKQSFENIAEASGRSADEMIRALRETSGNLITDIELMKSYNLAAQLVSDQFANQLPDAMGYLGRVAASTGQDMGYLLDSLVRGVGRLSPLILDNLGIQVSLKEAYDEYAATLGKTSKELTKAEQQTALMNAAMKQLAENTANLPDMVDPFTQLQVTMENFKTTLATAIGPVVIPLIQKLADTLTAFIQGDQFSDWLEKAADWLSNALPNAIKSTSDLWSNQLKPTIEAFLPIAKELFPIFADIAKFLGEILPPLITAFRKGWELQLAPIKYVIDRIKELIAAFNQLKSAVSNIKLPSWLTPGSPTPLELGLRGINDAMSALNKQALPGFGGGLAALPAGGTGGFGGGIVVHYAPVMSLGDRAEFEARFMPVMIEALRRANRGQV